MRKRTRLAALILLCCAGLAYTGVRAIMPRQALATCTGATPCNACKTCSSCAHCHKRGGTCGVCAKPKVAAAPGLGGELVYSVGK